MSHSELNRPVVIATTQGMKVVKSLCAARDYRESVDGLSPGHLILDAVHKECSSHMDYIEEKKDGCESDDSSNT